jgi:hypothetical protein
MKDTQAQRILREFKRKGKLYNYELSRYCLQYTGRIYDLRHSYGEPIVCTYVKPGVFLYTYNGTRQRRWWL